MNSTLIKLTAITALAAAATFGLSACASSANTDSSSTTQQIGPIVVDVATLNGTDVTINPGRMIDINTGTQDPADFTAVVADAKVATFTAGGKQGTATFNPGITGVASGMTKVALTNGKTGTVINFTVTVT